MADSILETCVKGMYKVKGRLIYQSHDDDGSSKWSNKTRQVATLRFLRKAKLPARRRSGKSGTDLSARDE